VLRLSDSSVEEPDDEEPEEPTPKVPSELEMVREKIVKADATLAKYNDDFLGDGAKGVTAEMVTMAQRALDKLCEKEARLEAPSSAPSCATGVVRKHFLREGVVCRVACLLRSFGPCNLNRVEGGLSSRECRA
jgi:hypothetical protein